ncbi:MAG TPA: alpha-L-rhamnosidase C-terminal domain-containing protein, partial [Steroidobacteraceae bacterium]|nr:alpha-L-rhamnosidase C-terminal domain-containing protein [Steroidobacteraceae bacterium]
NALAVLYRIPTSPMPDILTKLGSALRGPVGPLRSSAADGRIVSPYTSGYEVRARMDTGDTLAALDIIRRAWAPMRQGGAYYSGATWEYVDLQGLPGLGSGTSLAHPWSSGPTGALSAYVLGIRPLQPGFRTWLAEPQPGDLSWARGSVPTPHGPIQLEWSKRDAHLRMSVTVPAETQCFAGIPVRAGSARIEVNGRARNRAAPPDAPARPGYAYVGPLASGVHAVTESQD